MQALLPHGVKPCVPLGPELIGPPLRDTLIKISGTTDANVVDCLTETFKKNYDEEAYRSTKIFQGIDQALEFLASRGTWMYILTNKRIYPTRKIVAWLGWDHFFQGLYSVGAFEPCVSSKVGALAQILTSRAIPKSSAVYVGDRTEDLMAAQANDLPFVAVSWGHQNWSSIETPHRVLQAPKELLLFADIADIPKRLSLK